MIYENAEDRRNQLQIVRVVCGYMGDEFVQSPPLCSVDFLLYKPGYEDEPPLLHAMLEARRRHDTKCMQYPFYMIDRSKVESMLAASEMFKVPCLFAVMFDDAIAIARVKDWPAARTTGRTDRRDPNDVQPAVHVPWDDFTILPKASYEPTAAT